MQTSFIIKTIYQDFAKTYKNATPFVNSGVLWNFCLATIQNPTNMTSIALANDLGIPPVAALLLLYQRQYNPPADFRFPKTERQYMGALMGFVFKHVLGYKNQKDRCTVQKLGVQNAARFYNGPVHVFTI